MANQMHFASAIATEEDYRTAGQSLIEQIEAQMKGRAVDLAIIFLSPHFRAAAADLAERLRAAFAPGLLLGCTAEGVIGRAQEIERNSAIVLLAAHLPEIELTPFSLQSQSMNWENFLSNPALFRETVGAPESSRLFLLLADPFTTPIDLVLDAFNRYYTDQPMIGGMASGSSRAGGNALLLNERLLNNGAVGVAFSGSFEVDVIVSQGCRPIGKLLAVTEADQNMIYRLNGEAPLVQLQNLVSELSDEDRELLQNGLFLGRAIASGHEALGRGDFLIRNVTGIDQRNGALIVNDYIKKGETVQFHLRDASTATEDLEMMLAPQNFYEPVHGGLLFSCNGRGTHLYGYPNGDITTIQRVIGDINLAGFFCAGEIGPIGGKNFLHSYTASLALFRPHTTAT